MPILNQHWYNRNEGNAYPVDESASCVDDAGVRLPSDLLADLNLRWPEELGRYAFISAVAVTRGMVTVAIEVSSSDTMAVDYSPLAVVSVPRPVLAHKNYAVVGQVPGVGGWIAFGRGVNDTASYAGRYSTPTQSRLAPRAARSYRNLPVRSLGIENVATSLQGVVNLKADSPLEVVAESREIAGINRDCIVVRLVQPDLSGGATNTAQVESNVFQLYAGPCGGRPESLTCGDPQPIEFINAVGPDCDGRITLQFMGCADVSHISEPCGVLVDCNLGQHEACIAPFIPGPGGSLPGEFPPSATIPPSESLPVIIGVSISDVFLGDLPYTDCFLHHVALDFHAKSGLWVFQNGFDPNRICGTSASSQSFPGSTSFFPSASFSESTISDTMPASASICFCDPCETYDQVNVVLTISGMTAPTCDDCANLDGSYALVPLKNNPCTWVNRDDLSGISYCEGQTSLLAITLTLGSSAPSAPPVYVQIQANGFPPSNIALYGGTTMLTPGTTVLDQIALPSGGGGGGGSGDCSNSGRLVQAIKSVFHHANGCNWDYMSWLQPTSAGNTLVAAVKQLGVSPPLFGYNRPPGWIYITSIGYTPGDGSSWDIWDHPNAPSQSGIIDFNYNGICGTQAVVMEFAGMLAASLDTFAVNGGQSGNLVVTGTTATTAQADELWVAFFGLLNTSDKITGVSTFTPPGFTPVISLNAPNSTSISVWSSVVATTAHAQAAANHSGAGFITGGGGIVTFKCVSCTPPPPPPGTCTFPATATVTTTVIGDCPGTGTANAAKIRQAFSTDRAVPVPNLCNEWLPASWPLPTLDGSLLVAMVRTLPAAPSAIPVGWLLLGVIGHTPETSCNIYYRQDSPSVSGTQLLSFKTAANCWLQAIFLECTGIKLLALDRSVTHSQQTGSIIDSGTTAITRQANELWLGFFALANPSSAVASYSNGFARVLSSDAVDSSSLTIVEKLVTATGIAATQANAQLSTTLNGGGALLAFKAIAESSCNGGTNTGCQTGSGRLVQAVKTVFHHANGCNWDYASWLQPTVAGNTLIAAVKQLSVSPPLFGYNHPAGWVYITSVGYSSGDSSSWDIWYYPNAPRQSGIIDFNDSGICGWEAVFMEFEGVAVAPLDQSTSNAGQSGSFIQTGTTATTAQKDELWVSFFGLLNPTSSITGVTPGFVRAIGLDSPNSASMTVYSSVVTNTGAATCEIDHTGAGFMTGGGAIITLKLATDINCGGGNSSDCAGSGNLLQNVGTVFHQANGCNWNYASWPVPTTAGNTLIAVVKELSVSPPLFGYNHPAGWVYLFSVGQAAGDGSSADVWYYPDAPSQSGVIDFNYNGVCAAQAVYMEFEGVEVVPLDQTVTNAGQSGSFIQTGTTATTTQANELWLAFFGLFNTASSITSVTPGFVRAASLDAPNSTSMVVYSNVVTTAGAATCEIDHTGSGFLSGGGGMLTLKLTTNPDCGSASIHNGGAHRTNHGGHRAHSDVTPPIIIIGPINDPLYTSASAAARNITIWQGFDDFTVHRRVVTNFLIQTGPRNAHHNAGLVLNYQTSPHNPAQVNYYLALVDVDSQHVSVLRWTGTNFATIVSSFVPGLRQNHWYQLTVDVTSSPTSVMVKVHVHGFDDAINVTIGPMAVSNYGEPTGRFGLYADRAVVSFSCWHVEEL